MSEQPLDLQARLEDLGGQIDWPESNLAAGVVRAIETGRTVIPVNRRLGWVPAVAVLALIVVVLVATPGGRRAVADLLGVAGIEIRWGEAHTEPAGARLDLGEPVSMAEAAERVDFLVLAPAGPEPGPPDEVYLSRLPPGGLTMVWPAGPELPGGAGTGIGILFSQFRADVEEALLVKRLGPDTELTVVQVRGRRGYWIEGPPHTLLYRMPGGGVIEDDGRLAANVLVWEEDGVTRRMETAMSREATLSVAESLGPVGRGP